MPAQLDMPLAADDEGYGIALRDGRWTIIDRYSRPVPGEPTHPDPGPARTRADARNADVIAGRFA